MTFDDDMIRLIGEPRATIAVVTCKSLGVEWPPPEMLVLPGGFVFKRVRFSQITDAQREGMNHVFRGAEYEFVDTPALAGTSERSN